MVKNVEVKSIEANLLREKITQRLLRETGEQPKFTSYLNGYRQLNESIKNNLVSEEEFTSENLLRKLLLESVSDEVVTFRIGFLDACYRYITEGRHNRASYYVKDKKQVELLAHFFQCYLKLIVASVLLLTSISLGYYYCFVKLPAPFIEDFGDLDVDHLNKKGWTISEYNDSLWHNQLMPGHLTQWTTPGDNWVQTLKPHLDNFIYRKTGCDCFEVIVKVDSFRPTAKWQQYNLVFFENPDTPDEFLRIGRAYWGGSPIDTPFEITTLVEIKNRMPILLEDDRNARRESNRMVPVWLRVLVRHRRYAFSIRMGHEGASFRDMAFSERTFLTTPKYVGLATMQAYKSDYKDDVSPVIPVFYDTFIINSIPCD